MSQELQSTAPKTPYARTATRLRTLTNRHMQRGLAIAVSFTNDLEAAESILVRALAKEMARQDRQGLVAEEEGSEQFLRTLIQECQKRGRPRRSRPVEGVSEQLETLPDEIGESVQAGMQKELFLATQKLRKKEQAVFVLRFFEKLTLTEMAAILELPETKIGRLLFRAVQKIRYGNV